MSRLQMPPERESPTVTVVTTTFKRPEFLAEALASIAAQTEPPFEVIVVNNDPKTSADVDEVARSVYPDAKVVHNRTNLGQAGSKNVGIRQASGDVIALLDDDDKWAPNFLSSHVDAQSDPSIAVAFSGHSVVWDNVPLAPRSKIAQAPPEDVFAEMVRGRFTIGANSVLTFKTEVLREVGGYDENLVGFLDWDLLCRVARVGTFVHIPDPLATFRMHLGPRDSDPTLRLSELEQVRRKWQGTEGIDEMIRRFTVDAYFNASRYAAFSGDRRQAWKLYRQYVRGLRISAFDMSELLKLTLLVIGGPGLYCRLQRGSGRSRGEAAPVSA